MFIDKGRTPLYRLFR